MSNETPPHVRLMDLVMGNIPAQAVYAAAQLGVADHLGDGPTPARRVAAAVGADPDALYRLLRTLAGLGVVCESERGSFTLTPVGSFLRSDSASSMRPMILMMGSKWRLRAWEGIVHSIQTGKAAFDVAFGMGPFDYFRTDPEAAAIFNAAMVSSTQLVAPALARAYDFSGCRRIVELGGGHGYLMAEILAAHPTASGVLFDLPEVVAGASATLERKGVRDRCEIVGGDFFENVPRDGDVYLMKQIIHDWNDDRAAQILRNCRAASRGARLLAIETVIPDGNEPCHAKLLDLEVLIALGGKERTEDEYRKVYASAGFRYTRIAGTVAHLSLVEGVGE